MDPHKTAGCNAPVSGLGVAYNPRVASLRTSCFEVVQLGSDELHRDLGHRRARVGLRKRPTDPKGLGEVGLGLAQRSVLNSDVSEPLQNDAEVALTKASMLATPIALLALALVVTSSRPSGTCSTVSILTSSFQRVQLGRDELEVALGHRRAWVGLRKRTTDRKALGEVGLGLGR